MTTHATRTTSNGRLTPCAEAPWLSGRACVYHGQPAPGTSTWVVSTRPVPGDTISDMPRHSAATMNRVVPSGPPGAQAKPPRSSSTVCSTVPPSATRTHRWLGTSAYQTGVLRVDAEAVWSAFVEVGPDTSVGQPTVRADVEGHQAVTVRVRDDQGGVVGGHRHPIGQCDVVGHLAHRAARRDQGDETGLERLPGHQVEAGTVDVGVAPTVHHDVVPACLAEIRVGDQRPVGLPAQQRPSGDETITSRPSGSQAVHSGSDSTCAITSLWPARSTAMTSPADQSEKYNRSPCQRGDLTRPRPVSSVRTSFILVAALLLRRHGRQHLNIYANDRR